MCEIFNRLSGMVQVASNETGLSRVDGREIIRAVFVSCRCNKRYRWIGCRFDSYRVHHKNQPFRDI